MIKEVARSQSLHQRRSAGAAAPLKPGAMAAGRSKRARRRAPEENAGGKLAPGRPQDVASFPSSAGGGSASNCQGCMSSRVALKCPFPAMSPRSLVVRLTDSHPRERRFNSGRHRRGRRGKIGKGVRRPRSLRCLKRAKSGKSVEDRRSKSARKTHPKNKGMRKRAREKTRPARAEETIGKSEAAAGVWLAGSCARLAAAGPDLFRPPKISRAVPG